MMTALLLGALYWASLVGYLTSASVVFFFVGINWCKIETKYGHYPQKVVAVLYVANSLALYVLFQVPFLVVFVVDALQVAGVYMGTYFQCIGLTGGIATGKSTVSGILAENNFDIIDTDKISKEVSLFTGDTCVLVCVCSWTRTRTTRMRWCGRSAPRCSTRRRAG